MTDIVRTKNEPPRDADGFRLMAPKAPKQAEVARRANAYPKLVEALRWYAQGVEKDDDGACARAVLRELGETKGE